SLCDLCVSVVNLLLLLFRSRQQIDGGAQAALALEESLGQAVDQSQEGEQIADAAAALAHARPVRFRAELLRSQILLAAPAGVEDGVDLTALALGRDDGEHLPDVVLRFVVFTPVAALVDLTYQAPFEQLAQVHADVAARNLQPAHDVVSRQRVAG